jgi:hypothetical protein
MLNKASVGVVNVAIPDQGGKEQDDNEANLIAKVFRRVYTSSTGLQKE